MPQEEELARLVRRERQTDLLLRQPGRQPRRAGHFHPGFIRAVAAGSRYFAHRLALLLGESDPDSRHRLANDGIRRSAPAASAWSPGRSLNKLLGFFQDLLDLERFVPADPCRCRSAALPAIGLLDPVYGFRERFAGFVGLTELLVRHRQEEPIPARLGNTVIARLKSAIAAS